MFPRRLFADGIEIRRCRCRPDAWHALFRSQANLSLRNRTTTTTSISIFLWVGGTLIRTICGCMFGMICYTNQPDNCADVEAAAYPGRLSGRAERHDGRTLAITNRYYGMRGHCCLLEAVHRWAEKAWRYGQSRRSSQSTIGSETFHRGHHALWLQAAGCQPRRRKLYAPDLTCTREIRYI